MTAEEKQLLLKDLSARLPYRVKVHIKAKNCTDDINTLNLIDLDSFIRERPRDEDWNDVVTSIKPYLRPMSSISKMWGGLTKEEIENPWILFDSPVDALNYFLTNHIDFRGLIPMGLAIAVTEENDPYKN